MEVTMVRIQIDGVFYEVKPGKNLLETCLALGFDIPYFCNHPALGSVGACRLCAVKKHTSPEDNTGRIIMSCMEPVTDGMIISVNDTEVKLFRAAVIEGLMINHPHDCPICDEGGECHLQDMTVMTGHSYRRYSFRKRTFYSQDLGPFIHHEMNRCIQCYRCVRFYRDYTGGTDLNVFGSGNHIYFGRQKDGALESEFSGNLVEVCPTGVFTDKTLKKHFSRKWDLSSAPSVCVHCSLGCNIIVSERYGSVRRIMSRYNGSVNGYFICDRGRFGYEFINHPDRIKEIKVRASKRSDLNGIKDIINSRLSEALKADKIIGIGSPRASLEANFALLKLVGKENFFHGISGNEQIMIKKAVHILQSGFAHSPSLKEIEKCDAVLILGEDVANTAPMLALAIRQAARNKSVEIAAKLGIPKWNDSAVRSMDQGKKSAVFIASPFKTRLENVAEETYYFAPDDIARLGYAIASEITDVSPVSPNQDKTLQRIAHQISDVLSTAKNPLIVTGTGNRSGDILEASANIAVALSSAGKKSSLSIVFPECNSVGLSMLEGNSFDDIVEFSGKENIDTLIILENDLYRRISKEKTDPVLEKCKNVIVIDHLMNDTANRADILLPAAVFAESDGTIVNNEGRAQRFYNVLPVKEPVKESWRWISDMMKNSGKNIESPWERFDDVVTALATSLPLFSGLKDHMPDADSRFTDEKIPRQNKRYSGRTAMDANISVNEPPPAQDNDSPFNFSMEGYRGDTPSALLSSYWAPGWNSSQSVNKYMEDPGGPLKEGGDPGIRLFSDEILRTFDFFNNIPDPFTPKPGELLILPVYLVFGSEELSSMGEAICELIPESFLIMNEKEIKKLQINEFSTCNIIINQKVIKVNVKADNTVPDGVAGLSQLIRTIPLLELPAWGKPVSDEMD
jgi:NADH-quinone oxidoreductase subunit G